MNKTKLDFEEQLMLLLYFSDEYTSIKTRLMKLLFLFDHVFKLSITKNLGFKAHNFGPWASNFESHVTPLKIQGLIDSDYEKEMYKYFIVDEIKEKFKEVIKRKYVQNNNYSEEIALFKFFGEKYSDYHVNELIQLVYILEPDFAKLSFIKEEIMNLSHEYNQQNTIKLIEEIPTRFTNILFSDTSRIPRILHLFDMNDPDNENQDFITNLIVKLNLLYNNTEFKMNSILDILYSYPQEKKYHNIKLAMISIFSTVKNSFEPIIYKNILVFLFKTLQLTFPLSESDFHKFNLLLMEFKQKLGNISFFDYTSDLTEEERKTLFQEEFSSIELREGIIPNNQPLTTEKSIKSAKTATQNKKTLLLEDENDDDEDNKINNEFKRFYPIENK